MKKILTIAFTLMALAAGAQIVDDVYFTPSQARKQSRQQQRTAYDTRDFRKGAKQITFYNDTITTHVPDSTANH